MSGCLRPWRLPVARRKLRSQPATTTASYRDGRNRVHVTEEHHILACHLAEVVLRSHGELRLRVTGSSMLPAVWPGDVLSVRRRGAEQARPGDMILFARYGRLFAHRVVERKIHQGTPYWITRGDRLDHHDPQVSSS